MTEEEQKEYKVDYSEWKLPKWLPFRIEDDLEDDKNATGRSIFFPKALGCQKEIDHRINH